MKRYIVDHVATDEARRLAHVFLDPGGYWHSLPLAFARTRRLVGRAFDATELDELHMASREHEEKRLARRAAAREERKSKRQAEGKISQLRPWRDRVAVYLDGSYCTTAAASVVEQAGLAVGQSISKSVLSELENADSLSRARLRLELLVSYRPRSAAEARRRLRQAGFSESVADHALEQALTGGLLDDEAFVEWARRVRGQSAGRAWRQVRYELLRSGVAEELLESAREEDDTAALELAAGRARRGLDLADFTDRQRFGARLSRRGFGWPQIKLALESLTISDDQAE